MCIENGGGIDSMGIVSHGVDELPFAFHGDHYDICGLGYSVPVIRRHARLHSDYLNQDNRRGVVIPFPTKSR